MKTAPSTKRPSAASSPTPDALLKKLGLNADNPGVFCGEWLGSGKPLKSVSPIDGRVLATVRTATPEEYERAVQRAQEAFREWQLVPAPSAAKSSANSATPCATPKRDLGPPGHAGDGQDPRRGRGRSAGDD